MAITHPGVIFWTEELEESLITFDGLDRAIVGIAQVHTQPSRVVYSFAKIIDILIERDEMDYEDAIEFFEFNIAGLWAGPCTPAIIYPVGE